MPQGPPGMNSPSYRTARALIPDTRLRDEWEHLYEPLPEPDHHPELDLFGIDRAQALLNRQDDPSTPPAAPVTKVATAEASSFQDLMQARMMNEFIYCPRLFYYEAVEGVFLHNADTERGAALHEKVDRGRGNLARAKKKRADALESDDQDAVAETEAGTASDDGTDTENGTPNTSTPAPDSSETDIIHSRSAMLGSPRLGVVAKLDLIEVKVTARKPDDLFATREVLGVTPVDYKAGSPRQTEAGIELWDADKMQLGLQILILRDNGHTCEEGVIYYRGTKQRVPLRMTPELEEWIIQKTNEARAVAASPVIPPPLEHSPKCVRCSLAPVCLPDETRMLAQSMEQRAGSREPERAEHRKSQTENVRRLMAARDDKRALYLNTQGYRVGIKSERLIIKDGDRTVEEVRLMDVSHVALFGNIQLSTQAIHELCMQDIPIAYHSVGGKFYGITRGHSLKNITTRMKQFAAAANPVQCLAVAQRIVKGKIRNHRRMLMRNHIQPPASAITTMEEIAGRISKARGLDELLGMEGAAASIYFQHFAGMIKAGAPDDDDLLPGLDEPETSRNNRSKEAEAFTFDFTQRRRRPPTDPVNAMLSFAYALLAKDCTIAALSVGFDPYIGFYHQPRHGRPALALDLMEEFRPLIAESVVLTAINNRMVNPGHFVRAGDAVNLNEHGRKAFFNAYEQRMGSMITHPIFDYKVCYRRVIELQARLLARWLTGEIPDYVPMETR